MRWLRTSLGILLSLTVNKVIENESPKYLEYRIHLF